MGCVASKQRRQGGGGGSPADCVDGVRAPTAAGSHEDAGFGRATAPGTGCGPTSLEVVTTASPASPHVWIDRTMWSDAPTAAHVTPHPATMPSAATRFLAMKRLKGVKFNGGGTQGGLDQTSALAPAPAAAAPAAAAAVPLPAGQVRRAVQAVEVTTQTVSTETFSADGSDGDSFCTFFTEAEDELFGGRFMDSIRSAYGFRTIESDCNPEAEGELVGGRFGDTWSDTLESDGNATAESAVFVIPPGRGPATRDLIPPAVGALGSPAPAARSAPVKLEPLPAAASRGLAIQRRSPGAMQGAEPASAAPGAKLGAGAGSGELRSFSDCTSQRISTSSSFSVWTQQCSVGAPCPRDACVAADHMPCVVNMSGSDNNSLDGDDGGLGR